MKNTLVVFGFLGFFGTVVAIYPIFSESNLAALAASAGILIAGIVAIIWSGRDSSSDDSKPF